VASDGQSRADLSFRRSTGHQGDVNASQDAQLKSLCRARRLKPIWRPHAGIALVLHAHSHVRHPEHEHFLEENWLFEAITETYLPLLRVMAGWIEDGMETRLTLTLTPPLCSMLLDPLLQDRYVRHLDGLIELAEKEIHRTHWDKTLNPLAEFYLERFQQIHRAYHRFDRNLVAAFKRLQDLGKIEIITCAATRAFAAAGGQPGFSAGATCRSRPLSRFRA
jgi:hypothetical protein